MLKSLTLNNFRGFSEHRVDFGRESVLIGRNNAGKTTVVEALRILSVCQSRAANASFIPTPDWLTEHCQGAGFRVSLDTIDFDFSNVHHGYDDTEPAIIKAKLLNNNEVHVYLDNQGQAFCQLRRGKAHIIFRRNEIPNGAFGNTKVMPPVGTLLPREKMIGKQRMMKFLDGYLAYRHFRNQLWEFASSYKTFKDLMEGTWQNLQIQEFANNHGEDGKEFSLLIREGKFSSEISWHGHGLQAWAQTIWFLSRMSKQATVVLDEPDVYLHADLQRKLIKVVENLGFRQILMATHSPEIISDVPFKSVVVINKREKSSKPALIASEIQDSLREMGSIHSIQLSKLADKGLILFVEGGDKAFLSDVAYKMGVGIFDSFSEAAIQEIKGKGNWQQAIGAARVLKESSGGDIEAALLLDGDYMTDEERAEFETKAADAGLALKIWSRKEIENYFLIYPAITRYVNIHLGKGSEISENYVRDIVDEIGIELKTEIVAAYAESAKKFAKGAAVATLLRKSGEIIASKENNGLRLVDMACGKDVFSKLSEKFQASHSVSFSALSICKEAKLSEIPEEIATFVEKIASRVRGKRR